jgi:hypothetical protein
MKQPSRPTPAWLIVTVILLGALVGGGVMLIRERAPLTRQWVVAALEDRYRSKVEIKSFEAALFPRPSAVAEGLAFREGGRTDIPPFITMRRLTVEASFLGLLESPRKIDRVVVEGLQIHVPPRKKQGEPKKGESGSQYSRFVVGEFIADGTALEILPKDAAKKSKLFEIGKLDMHSLGLDRALTFASVLTNPTPPGEIHSKGEFGPWQRDDPGSTPVSGTYTFENANMGVFKGIAGILSSTGKYKGELGRIDVEGDTDTPDFALTAGGHKVDLKTHFHSIVDGTTGDTLLQPVDAHFLHSRILARGGVTNQPGVEGKTVSLDLDVKQARVEDMLTLAVSSQPAPLSGGVSFQGKLIIPPGKREVLDKMYLAATFSILSARFANLDIEQKIRELSRRARGQTEPDSSEKIASNMKGRFVLKDGVASFSQFSFAVPGALIQLTGSYGMKSEALNFVGSARLEAKLSQMTTGIASKLLKVVDPFFRKDGATVIPIKISGTRSAPSFGLNFNFGR